MRITCNNSLPQDQVLDKKMVLIIFMLCYVLKQTKLMSKALKLKCKMILQNKKSQPKEQKS